MIYEPLKALLLRLLKAPTEPPDPPEGSYDSVRVFRASPRFLQYRLFGVAVTSGFLFLLWVGISIALIFGDEPWLILLSFPIATLFTLVAVSNYASSRIDYDMRYYIVTDRSLRIREGAFTIREMTLTHANVQNLNIVQGPAQRFFGIRNLAVETAGGGGGQAQGATGHSFQMAGIENAEEVRDLVLNYLKLRGHGSGLGDLDDERATARTGLGAAGVEALRELRDASAALRRAAEARA
ncbi:MAG: PH domain-containing protein [Planctomycetota bacterium]